MAKKYYNIEIKDDAGQWYSPIGCQSVSKVFTKGYIACSKSYYPSPDLRIITADGKEIIEEIRGNRGVTTNKIKDKELLRFKGYNGNQY